MQLSPPVPPTVDVYLVRSDSAGFIDVTGQRTPDKKQAREFTTFSQALAAAERPNDRIYRRQKPIPLNA